MTVENQIGDYFTIGCPKLSHIIHTNRALHYVWFQIVFVAINKPVMISLSYSLFHVLYIYLYFCYRGGYFTMILMLFKFF